MTNDSRRFGFTYGYDDAVTAAMQERTYQWMDIVFVDFGEISGDCLLRKSRPAIVLSGTEYNESSPILTVAPMTRSLKGLDSKYHVFIDREDCNNELNTSGMCILMDVKKDNNIYGVLFGEGECRSNDYRTKNQIFSETKRIYAKRNW